MNSFWLFCFIYFYSKPVFLFDIKYSIYNEGEHPSPFFVHSLTVLLTRKKGKKTKDFFLYFQIFHISYTSKPYAQLQSVIFPFFPKTISFTSISIFPIIMHIFSIHFIIMR